MRAHYLAVCLLLSGCCWWGDDAPLPEPATNANLSGAEADLDHLTDKRDSRVAAAVTVAGERAEDTIVKGELEVAKAMLPAPGADDLKWAKARAEKGDDAFYAEQVKVSQQLAAALVKANADYEQAKARKQAEYEARLKEKEMALAAEIESRQADRWTFVGIGLVTIGILAAVFSPFKVRGAALAVAGVGVGAFPMLSRQPWFLPGVLGLAAVSIATLVVLARRKPAPSPDAPQPPPTQG